MNKHAEQIKQYAEDCIQHKEPWLKWETCPIYSSPAIWYPLDRPPEWAEYQEYRRKPKTYKINIEFTSDEVYAPDEVIPYGSIVYYTPKFSKEVCSFINDKRRLTLVTTTFVYFKTKEAAQKWLNATKFN